MSLLPHLNSQQLLSDADNEEMTLGQVPEHDRIIRLLSILQKKGESGFHKFLTALEQASDHTPHHDIAEKLKHCSHVSMWKTKIDLPNENEGQKRLSTSCSMDELPLQNQELGQDSYQGKNTFQYSFTFRSV